MSSARTLKHVSLLLFILSALCATPLARAAAPSLTGVSPASGQANAAVTLTFSGSGFDTATLTNNVVNFGALAPAQTVVSAGASSLVVTITLPSGLGGYNVTVTTPGGQSNPVTFTVNPAPSTVPSLTSVSSSPSSAKAAAAVTLNLTGANFTATGNTITLTPTGGGAATVFGAVNDVSASVITSNVTLPAAGTYDVTVINANGGPSNPISFTVNVPPPTLSSVTPRLGQASAASVVLSFSGTGFDAVTPTNNIVNFNGAALSVQSVNPGTTTTALAVSVTLPSGAGGYSVSVSVSGNTSNSVTFTVNPPPPSVSGVASSPASALANNLVTLTMTGAGFTTTTPNSVTLTGTTGANAGKVFTFGSAPAGSAGSLALSGTLPAPDTYAVQVSNANGASGPGVSLTVNPGLPPTLASVVSAPSSAVTGTAATLSLVGTNFLAGTNTVTFTGTTGTNAGIATVFGSAGSSDSQDLTLVATLPVPADTYNVTVTNANGVTGAVVFAVNNPAPAITGLSPGAGVAQTTVSTLTITGSGFVAGSTPTLVGPGGTTLTPAGFTVNSATQITVSGLTLPASPGTVIVTVANPAPGAGTSNAAPFTVNPPPPSVSGVASSPASAITGTSVTLTMTGAGFTTTTPNSVTLTGTTGANAGKVFTFGSAPAGSAGSLALSGTLPAPDTYAVQVSNANGASGPGVSLTVNPGLPPTLAAVSSDPSPAITGDTITLSLVGTNFLAGTNTVTFTGTTGTNAGIATVFGSAGSSDSQNLTLSHRLLQPADTYLVAVSNANGTTAPGVSFTVSPVPVPTLASVAVSPTAAIAGTNTTLTLTGTNFTTASSNTVTLTLSGGGPITFGSTTSADGATLVISGALPAPGLYAVTVRTQYGTSGAVSLTINNPAPVISGLTPKSGSPTLTISAPSIINPLIITGSGFVAGSKPTIVSTDGTTVLTPAGFTVDSSTQISVHQLTLPTTSGSITVTVTNPDPGGSTSNAVLFTVNSPPSLASAVLASGTSQAGGSVTLTLTGTGFTTLTTNTVFFNGAPFGNATSPDGVTLLVSGALPPLSGSYTVIVGNVNGTTNPGSGFTVTNPTPIIINIDPKSGPAGNTVGGVGQPPLTITGSGFVRPIAGAGGSTVSTSFSPADGTTTSSPPLTFKVVSTTQITVTGLTLPTKPGTLSIMVSNPDPGGSTSNAALFQVSTIAPTLSSVSSSRAATPGLTVTLTLIGTNFLSSAAAPFPNTVTLTDASGVATSFGTASATALSGGTAISLQGVLPSIPGIYTVTVSNVNGASSALTFTINNPVPTISAPGLFDKNGAAYTSDTIKANITLVIQGTGFLPLSPAAPANVSVPVVTFNGTPLSGYTAVVGSTTQITLTNLTLPATAGALTVKVRNPDSSGGSGGLDSNPAQFNVINTAPFITGITGQDKKPVKTSVVSTSITLTITGTGFVDPGSVPFFSFTPTNTKTSSPISPSGVLVDSGAQTITVRSLQLPPVPGAVTVTVVNPGLPASNQVTFQVEAQRPVLGSLSPPSILVGDPAFTALTVNGPLGLPGTFVASSSIYFGKTDATAGIFLDPTFNSAAALTGAINTAATQNVQTVGQVSVTVHTTNGFLSDGKTPDPPQDLISQPALSFNVLPLGPTHLDDTGKVGLATNYFAAKSANGHDGFLFFSVPYDYSDKPADPKTGAGVLADIDPATLITAGQPHSKLAVWDPTVASYTLTGSGTLANALVLGRGYWGRFPDPTVTPTVITGLVSRGKAATDVTLKDNLDGAGRFKIALLPGWNMIGDPWESPVGVRLQNIQVATPDADPQPFVGGLSDASAQGLTSSVFFEYSSPANAYIAGDGTGPDARLRPYVGYWVHAYRACTLLVPQP